MKRNLLTCIILLFFSYAAISQVQVTGKVIDENQEPLPGVNIIVKGTINGTVTDFEGNYTISAPADAVLVFSFIGYNDEEQVIGGRARIELSMLPNMEALDEVIVTALGIKRETKALGYSAQDIKSDDLTQVQNPEIATSLQGRIAGIQVKQAGGTGGQTSVILRGISSFVGNNEPLYIVDGVPVSNDFESAGSEWGDVSKAGGVFDLNPDDIENISVLKGPNASALYGYRGANGVIMITTKSGSKQKDKLGVEFSTGASWEKVDYLLDMQNKYGQGTLGMYMTNQPRSWGDTLNNELLPSWTGDSIPYSAQNNLVDDFFRTGVTQNYNIAIAGSNEKGAFRASISRNSIDGVYSNFDIDKTSVNIKSDYQINDFIKVESKINYLNTVGNNRPMVGYYGSMRYLYQTPRNIRTEDLRPGYDFDPLTGSHVENLYTKVKPSDRNPYFLNEQKFNNDERDRVIGYLSANIKIIDDLNLRLKYGTDFFRERTVTGYNYGDVTDPNRPSVEKTDRFFKEDNAELLLSYTKNFGDFKFDFGAGGNYMNNYRESLTAQSGLIENEGSITINDGSNKRSLENSEWYQVQSVYGYANVMFKNYLFFDGTYRSDWNSTLPLDDNQYNFYSASLSYILTDAFKAYGINFNESILSFAKLRASYGKAGKGTDVYNLTSEYKLETGALGLLNATKIEEGNNVQPNIHLRPEETNSFELGADVRLFDNRIGLDFTYYNALTGNQIARMEMAHSTGYTHVFTNVGSVSNKGIELLLKTTPVKTNDFTLNIDFNFAKNKTLLEEINDDYPSATYQDFGEIDGGWGRVRSYLGEEFGVIEGKGFLYNDNGQLLVDASGLPRRTEDLIELGHIQPDWNGGINLFADYKGFFVSSLIEISMGGEIVSHVEARNALAGTAKITENRDVIVVDGVLEDGTINEVEVSAQDYWGRVSTIAGAFAYDASYMKLKEVVIGYNLPQSLLKNIPVASVRLSAYGRNLFYFINNLPGTTPDGGAYNTTYLARGFDSYSTPSSRIYGFSLNVKF